MLIYGYLYNKIAARGGTSTSSNNFPSALQGICPDGWHLPSDAEWEVMIEYVTNQALYNCQDNQEKIAKSLASSGGWSYIFNGNYGSVCSPSNNLFPNDATGFSALPAGDQTSNLFGEFAGFWSTTDYDEQHWGGIVIWNTQDSISHVNPAMQSVRCLKD